MCETMSTRHREPNCTILSGCALLLARNQTKALQGQTLKPGHRLGLWAGRAKNNEDPTAELCFLGKLFRYFMEMSVLKQDFVVPFSDSQVFSPEMLLSFQANCFD